MKKRSFLSIILQQAIPYLSNLKWGIFFAFAIGMWGGPNHCLFAQHGQPERCATMPIDSQRRTNYPALGSLAEFEEWLQRSIDHPSRVTRELVTLPVIVHIIHDGEEINVGNNISEAQVISQIEVLNEDFRRLEGSPGFNSNPIGADIEIEFCLAKRDMENQELAEVGIHRVNRNERQWLAPPFSSSYIQEVIKPATYWNPKRYLNIWVLPLNEDSLGFAQFPIQSGLAGIQGADSPETDGIVLTTKAFGRVGNVTAPFNRGRTATHEVGHWLGLRHIWGDGGCSVDDYCEDTPKADGPNYGCPTDSISCGSRDMVNNYMDYTNDLCMDIFTLCQKERMRTVLENSPYRKELVFSTACAIPQSAPIANFELLSDFSCDGTFKFIDTSEEFPSNWFWVFSNGSVDSVKNPVVSFESPGTYQVTLFANNFLGTSAPVTKSFTVDFESQLLDLGQDTSICQGDTLAVNANYLGPSALFSWLPTEGLSHPHSLQNTLSPEASTIYKVEAVTENGCIASDTLSIEVNPQPTIEISPKSPDVLQLGDSLQLHASGADSYEWAPPGRISDPFSPSPNIFPETSTTYIVTGTNANGCSGKDSVYVEVSNPTNSNANRLPPGYRIYPLTPNPAIKEVLFEANLSHSLPISISLEDIRGKTISSIFEGKNPTKTFSYRWKRNPAISPGLYFVKWRIGTVRFVQKVRLF